MGANAVAVVGLGNMGTPIARNLLASGYAVTVYNRSRDKAEPLAGDGATIADSPAAAVTSGGVVISLLSNDAVLEQAVREYVERKRRATPRAQVMAHFQASVEKNRRLGELLAR